MVPPTLILLGLILPAVIAGGLALVGGLLLRNHSWPAILGLCIGLPVAYRGINDIWPTMHPVDSPERIVVFAGLIGIIAMLASVRRAPWPVRVMLAILAPAAIVWYVFKPLPESSMPPAQMWRWIAVSAGIATVLYASTEALAIESPGVAAPLVLGPVAAGVGAVLLLVGTTKLGWMGAATGLMILGWFFAALIRKSVVFTRGPVYVVIALLTGLLMYDYFESESITGVEIAALAVAPLLAWIVEVPALRSWKAWKRELLRVAIVAIPVGIAVTLAFIQHRKDFAGQTEM